MQFARRSVFALAGLLLSIPAAQAGAVVVSAGTVLVNLTGTFDPDAGTCCFDSPTMDVEWDNISPTNRSMVWISGGGTLANIGVVNFANVTLGQLQALVYSTTGIDGSDASNVLVQGDVFAIFTNLGNYAKVLVTNNFLQDPGKSISLQWETDSAASTPPPQSGVPEPASLVLVGAGILFGLFRRTTRAR